VKIVVLNNSSLAQIKSEQMLFLGNPEFGCDLQPVDFAVVADGFGVRGIRLEDPEQCAGALELALQHEGPVLVDAHVDANEPMLPPTRRDKYVKNLSKALEKGTAGRKHIERALGEEPAATSLRK
jgi:thiamine pyrophosphate-dependent acetolactate synthase large subunit-like protein